MPEQPCQNAMPYSDSQLGAVRCEEIPPVESVRECSMWDLNYCVTIASIFLILINILVGLLFVAYGLYVVFLPWGDAESYQAIGICLTLFGVAFTCGSYYGFLSVQYQLRRYGGSWTGRAAIAGYQFLLLILLIALILAYIYGNAWLADVKTAIDELHANPASDPDYSMPEAVIRDYFNKLFFTAIQSCKSDYTWFWSFINDICPDSVSSESCEKCSSFSATFCGADEYTCYESLSAPPGQSYACPYVICREGYLRWLNRTSNKYFAPVIYATWGITIALLLLTLYLICHNQTRKVVVKVSEPKDEELATGKILDMESRPPPPVPADTPTPSDSVHASAPSSEQPTPAMQPTVALPPPLTLSSKSLDLDIEDAIIDSFITSSEASNPVVSVTKTESTSSHRQHTTYSSESNSATYSALASTSTEMRYSGRQEGIGGRVSGDDNPQRSPRSHRTPRSQEGFRPVNRQAYNQGYAPPPGPMYNPGLSRHSPHHPGAEDLQLEIAMMESLGESNHGRQSAPLNSHGDTFHKAHRQHALAPTQSELHMEIAMMESLGESNHGRQSTPLNSHGDTFHKAHRQHALAPTQSELHMEIAMMESLQTQSREDRDVERAILQSVQAKKQPIGIPTSLVASPVSRAQPRNDAARTKDSELDQAIIQSILENK